MTLDNNGYAIPVNTITTAQFMPAAPAIPPPPPPDPPVPPLIPNQICVTLGSVGGAFTSRSQIRRVHAPSDNSNATKASISSVTIYGCSVSQAISDSYSQRLA